MSDFYGGKKVVVTGGAGFVGPFLVRRLLAAGADVLVLDDFSRGRTRIEGVRYDLGSAESPVSLRRAFKDAFAVFNLAAFVAGVIYNQQHQLQMYAENARLQVTPVQAASDLGVPHFLQVSSVCVYAPEHNHPATEDKGLLGEPVGANNGYSWAKRMGERAVLWSSLPHAVIVRPSNIYGPGDYYDDRAHVIPALVRKALTQDTITVNGSGYEEREFLYVEDAAEGMMAALEFGADKQAYNLGTGGSTCIPIAALVELIQQAAGTDKPVTFASAFDPGDESRWSDCEKMASETLWRAETNLGAGIERTVEDARRRPDLG